MWVTSLKRVKIWKLFLLEIFWLVGFLTELCLYITDLMSFKSLFTFAQQLTPDISYFLTACIMTSQSSVSKPYSRTHENQFYTTNNQNKFWSQIGM